MSIFDGTLTVAEGGLVTVQVSQPAGTRVHVTVAAEPGQLAEETGRGAFATASLTQVLADPVEDVWNDL